MTSIPKPVGNPSPAPATMPSTMDEHEGLRGLMCSIAAQPGNTWFDHCSLPKFCGLSAGYDVVVRRAGSAPSIDTASGRQHGATDDATGFEFLKHRVHLIEPALADRHRWRVASRNKRQQFLHLSKA